jgi:hypothetical protein
MQERLAQRCDQLARTKESDVKRFTEHRVPWDRGQLARTQHAALRPCALHMRCGRSLGFRDYKTLDPENPKPCGPCVRCT